ncbi:oligosaccharide flippase family protein [Flavobacterium sp.]|uniref:oligosaccharide flippase family protein n=1 Tax=Flavobacterium sp. TaxID=239 RepID=UPI002CA5C62C|nr:oligosaccharide flippase family protein [Flavobacterium sp.]HSD06126.1 oligosaccharide flippase family protein [Flavobacterium sp.]
MLEQNTENSHKEIIKATGVFGFVQVLRMLVSVIGIKFAAVFLGSVGIGTLGLLNNTIGIIGSLTNFGLNITGVREVSSAYSDGDHGRFSERLTVLKRWSFIVGLFGTIVTILLSKLLSKWTFGTEENYFWFVILSVNFVFLSVSSGRIAMLQGLRKIRLIAISNVWSSVFITLVTIPLYYFFKFDGIVPVILLSSLIGLLFNLYYTRDIEVKKVNLSFSETIRRGQPLLKMGFLLSINVIFGQICNYIIKLYLNGNGATAEILGFYEVSSVILLSYVGLVFNAMGTDFYPRLVAVQNDDNRVNQIVNDQIEIGLLLVTPLLSLLYLLAPFFIEILYTKEFSAVTLIFKGALFAVIIKAVIWPLAFIILAKGQNKLYFKQELLGDFLNITLAIAFYHWFGLEGIGIASIVNFTVYGIYVYRILNRKFNFSIRKDTFKILLVSLLIGLLNCLVVFFVDSPITDLFLGILSSLSVFYSYKELDKRIDISSYYAKIRNKIKRN